MNVLTADDLYLFNEGSHCRLYEKLGAHPMTVEGLAGTHFAVWAHLRHSTRRDHEEFATTAADLADQVGYPKAKVVAPGSAGCTAFDHQT